MCDTIDTCMRRTVIGRANWVLWSRCWRIQLAPTHHKPKVHPKSYQELWKTWSEWRMCSKVSVQGSHMFSCSLKSNPKISLPEPAITPSDSTSNSLNLLPILMLFSHIWTLLRSFNQMCPPIPHYLLPHVCCVPRITSCFWSIVTSLWKTSFYGVMPKLKDHPVGLCKYTYSPRQKCCNIVSGIGYYHVTTVYFPKT